MLVTDTQLVTAGTGLFSESSLPSARTENSVKALQLSTERLCISLRGRFTFFNPTDSWHIYSNNLHRQTWEAPWLRVPPDFMWIAGALSRQLAAAGSLEITASILSFHVCLQSCKCQSLSSAPQTKRVSKSANVVLHPLTQCMLSYCTSFTSLSDGSVRKESPLRRRGAGVILFFSHGYCSCLVFFSKNCIRWA